ncbi:MAG TPA: transcription termination/antitermination NusG family protein, partial [Thermodesulfobacteriota bacterium]|nr:transcription termination/antitermination NusG family protein [Thermodesulfobacteriota bacterium]
MENHLNWYVVYTRSHYENKVFQALTDKSITAFLPTIAAVSRRKDRKKILNLPLFPGYVFFQIPWELKLYWDVLKTDGVVKTLNMGGGPAPVPEEEVSS